MKHEMKIMKNTALLTQPSDDPVFGNKPRDGNGRATQAELKHWVQNDYRKWPLHEQRAFWKRTLRPRKDRPYAVMRDVGLVLQLGLTCGDEDCTAPEHTNICHIPGFVVCAVGATYDDTVQLVKQSSDDELLSLVYSW